MGDQRHVELERIDALIGIDGPTTQVPGVTSAAERVYWYALMDLPERWEAVTRHRGSEGSAYYRH